MLKGSTSHSNTLPLVHRCDLLDALENDVRHPRHLTRIREIAFQHTCRPRGYETRTGLHADELPNHAER